MAKVRTGGAEKWSRKASQSTADYEQGVKNPRADWQQATVAATENQKQGVLDAISRGSFEKGVKKAGSAKWQTNALAKGQQRYVEGVQQATNDYESAVAPYMATIEGTQLPPRYPKGDPRNIQRVKAINDALRKKKLAM